MQEKKDINLGFCQVFYLVYKILKGIKKHQLLFLLYLKPYLNAYQCFGFLLQGILVFKTTIILFDICHS